MSLRKRFPLETLVRLREHRTETARLVLMEKQRQTQACRDQCTRIDGEIQNLQRDRTHQRAQLLAPPPPGMAWPAALEQRERHVEHLAELAVAAQERLKQAQITLRQAEQAQDEARTAYFRARARQEALEQRREVWRREQRGVEARREEAAAEDLLLGRRPSLIHS
jgi:flagellar biosynthesis chaperone FliJ